MNLLSLAWWLLTEPLRRALPRLDVPTFGMDAQKRTEWQHMIETGVRIS